MHQFTGVGHSINISKCYVNFQLFLPISTLFILFHCKLLCDFLNYLGLTLNNINILIFLFVLLFLSLTPVKDMSRQGHRSLSSGLFSVFNADAISSVKLTKGGFPARYGGRLSSVLDIRMKEGNMEEFPIEDYEVVMDLGEGTLLYDLKSIRTCGFLYQNK